METQYNITVAKVITVSEETNNNTTWKENIIDCITIFDWLKNYGKYEFFCDIIAGISIGLTLIPQSIAYASIIGLTPEYGLNSTFVGCILYAFFGTVKEVGIGPAAVLSVVTLEYTYNVDGSFAILLTFLAGCTEISMSIFRLGFVSDFISLPVSVGYVIALAIVIACTQLKGLMGVQFKSRDFIENVQRVVEHSSETRLNDMLVGFLCIMILLSFKLLGTINIKKKSKFCRVKSILWFLSIARNAIIVIFGITLAYFFQKYNKTIPFGIIGNVKSGLPRVQFPPTHTTIDDKYYSFLDMVKKLGFSIIGVPIMSIMTNISIAKVYKRGAVIRANRELFALGICNLFSSFVGAIPVCGAITRSGVGHASNIQSPIAGVFTGIVSILVLSIFSPYFNLIPRATLSAVLITCVLSLIDIPTMILLWKADKKDLVVMISTIIMTLIFGFVFGLFLSIAISIIRLLYSYSTLNSAVHSCTTTSGNNYFEIIPDSGLFFPTVSNLRNLILTHKRKDVPIVINCKHFFGSDFTAVKELHSLVTDFNKHEERIILINTNSDFKFKWHVISSKNTLTDVFSNSIIELRGNLSRNNTITLREEKESGREMKPLMNNANKIEIISEKNTQ